MLVKLATEADQCSELSLCTESCDPPLLRRRCFQAGISTTIITATLLLLLFLLPPLLVSTTDNNCDNCRSNKSRLTSQYEGESLRSIWTDGFDLTVPVLFLQLKLSF